MKPSRFLPLATLSLITLSSAHAGLKKVSVEAKLQHDYNLVTQGMQHKNLSCLHWMLDPHFTATDPTGVVVTKAEIIKDFTQMSKRAKSLTWPRHIKSIKLTKNEAIVIVYGTFSAEFAGPHGKLQKNQLIATNRDTWVDHHGKWTLLKSVILHRTALINGKPMKMPMSGKSHPKPEAPSQSK